MQPCIKGVHVYVCNRRKASHIQGRSPVNRFKQPLFKDTSSYRHTGKSEDTPVKVHR